MKRKLDHYAGKFLFALLAFATLAQTGWAAPPSPPAIVPSVPVGSPEISIVSALGIMGYGIWKSRR